MKKNCIIQAVLVALLVGQTTVAQDRSQASHKAMPGVAKPERISRLKKEYQVFREAFKCVRKSGLRGCTPAQKKRIVAVVISLAALVGMFGILGYRFIVIPPVPTDDGGDDDVIEVGRPEQRELPASERARVTGEVRPRRLIRTFEGGRLVGVDAIGESASYTIRPRPSRFDRFRMPGSKRETPVKEKKGPSPVEEKKGPSPTEQPVEVFTSHEDLQRGVDEAIRTGKAFRGTVQAPVLSGHPSDPDYKEKRKEFNRGVRQGN